MAGVEVRFTGLEEWKNAVVALGERMNNATQRAVNEALRTAAMQERTMLGMGRHPPGTKTGSPPGSPPWMISGDLRDSVKVRRAIPKQPGVWYGEMGPTSIYSRIQELGGDTGAGHRTHLPPRPHLYPAWRIVKPTMRDVLWKAWRDAQRF